MKNIYTRTILLISLSCIAIFAAGCQTAQEPKPANTPATNSTASKSTPSDVNVEIKTEPELVEAGKPVTIALTLKDEKGAVIKDLKIAHEKLLHLLVVSNDLQDFYHLHPDQQQDGTFIVKHTFPAGGAYTAFLDMVLPNDKQVVKTLGLGVSGAERPKSELKADASLVKTVDGLRVEMKTDKEPTGGKDATLKFSLTDAATGKAPMDMEKYLGEDAHFVILSQDLKDFVHAHPMSGDHGPTAKHAHHVEGHDSKGGTKGKEVSAHVLFPKGGLYKIWAQFQRAGKIITVPFVINAKLAEGEMDLSKIEIPAGAVKVTVSKTGYTPNLVHIKSGKPTSLAFIRIDEQNCGGELSFPELNIKKELAVGKVVTVEIPAEKSGELQFTCGMSMYKGTILIE